MEVERLVGARKSVPEHTGTFLLDDVINNINH